MEIFSSSQQIPQLSLGFFLLCHFAKFNQWLKLKHVHSWRERFMHKELGQGELQLLLQQTQQHALLGLENKESTDRSASEKSH